MPDEDIVKVVGAVEDIAKAHKALAGELEKLKSQIDPQVKELPAVKEKVAAVEKAVTEKSDHLAGQIKELQTLVGQAQKALAAMGAAGGDSPMLSRIDPGYYNPNQKRYMPNATAAKAMALFVHAVCSKSTKHVDALEKLGVNMQRVSDVERAGEVTSDEAGGYLVPPEFGGVIIEALPNYGVAPQYCDIEPMSGREKIFSADGNDANVYPLEEGGDIDEETDTYSQRTLVSRLFGAYARWSADLEEYAAVSQGELWTRRFSRAIAKKIDQCVFRGDGAAGVYGGMLGILNDANAVSVSLPANKTAFSDIEHSDIVALISAVPDEVYLEGNCRFFGSSNLFWLLTLITDGVGRPLYTNVQSGQTQILGEEYVRAHVMPRQSDSGAGAKALAFGDLRRAMKLGIRNRMVIDFSSHAFFTKGQNAIRVMARFGNKSSEARAFAILKTADA